MIHGIMSRIAGGIIAESKVYEGLKERRRFFDFWASMPDTEAIQFAPYPSTATQFKNRTRSGMKRGPRLVADAKFKYQML